MNATLVFTWLFSSAPIWALVAIVTPLGEIIEGAKVRALVRMAGFVIAIIALISTLLMTPFLVYLHSVVNLSTDIGISAVGGLFWAYFQLTGVALVIFGTLLRLANNTL